MDLVPQVEDLRLVCQDGLAIWFISADVLSSGDRECIVDVAFQHPYSTPEDQNPDHEQHERLPDDLGHTPTKVIAPVNVSLATDGYDLKYLI